MYFIYLPPQNEVAGRLCFYTCLSVILFIGGGVSASGPGRGVCHTPWADTPLDRHPPGQTPPWTDTSLGRHPLPSACWDTHFSAKCMLEYTRPPAQCILGYGQQAGGTHPTGMHSFFVTFQQYPPFYGDDVLIYNVASGKPVTIEPSDATCGSTPQRSTIMRPLRSGLQNVCRHYSLSLSVFHETLLCYI